MLIAVALVAVIAFLGVLPLQVCRDYAFICENTGSHKGYRQWCFWSRAGTQWHHESRLEQFMQRQHPTELKYRWTSYAGTGKNILGRSIRFGHDRPQVGSIIMNRTWFDTYVDTLDDTAKLDLYRVLASGDRDAIEAEEKKIEEIGCVEVGLGRSGRSWISGGEGIVLGMADSRESGFRTVRRCRLCGKCLFLSYWG